MCDYIVKPYKDVKIARVFKPLRCSGLYLVPCNVMSIYPIRQRDGETYLTVGGRGDDRVAVKLVGLHCDGVILRLEPGTMGDRYRVLKRRVAKKLKEFRTWLIKKHS